MSLFDLVLSELLIVFIVIISQSFDSSSALANSIDKQSLHVNALVAIHNTLNARLVG